MPKSNQGSVARPEVHPAVFRTSRRAILKAAGVGALAMTGPAALPAASTLAQEPTQAGVVVYPSHGTVTASPDTEITFRGVSADLLESVIVSGSETGGHSGVLVPHSDGGGVSYVPDAPFAPAEEVRVRADMRLLGAADGSVTFTVARPVPTELLPRVRETENPKSPTQTFRSRPDLQPPVIEVTTSADGTAPGYVVCAARVPDGQAGATILNNRGDVLWFAPSDVNTSQYFDVRVQQYRDQPVLTMFEGAFKRGYGYGHYVMYDTSYQRIAEVQAGNGMPGGDIHEFLLTPQGTALNIVYYPVRWDLSEAGGATDGVAMDQVIQEIDIETGRVLFEWHSLDHVGLDESYKAPSGEDEPFDYFHMNSVEIDDEGNFIISARHTFTVYKIDRRTGQVRWRLNGKQSDFTMSEGTEFAYQHDARVHANNELSLFDNANRTSEEDPWSRGILLQVDEETMTATLAREYIHPTRILSDTQANMQLLPNDNVFIGWGSAPVFSEFSPEGDVLFNGRFPDGVTSYRAYRYEWTGQPSAPPDISAESDSAIGATVYASWNGATEVANWQVLAGSSPDQLQPTGSATPRNGFETAITVPTAQQYVAVQALDEAGTVLGTSESVSLET